MTTLEVENRSEMKPTLPSRYYYGPDIYELEKERIFYSSWICAGRAEQVPNPGDFFRCAVADESVIIVRDKAGSINAFYNVCRHRGNRLCTEDSGRFKAGALACRYHGWTYALDGKLIATPNMVDADRFRKEDFSLYPVAVQLWEGFIFINLSSEPEPFTPDLGKVGPKLHRYNLSNLRLGYRKVYDIKANWKLVIENNVECYHCPGVHPELCEIQPGFKSGIIGQEEADGAYLVDGGSTYSTSAKTTRPLISTITKEDEARFRSVTLYPNLFLGLLPEHVFVFYKWPVGPKETRLVVEWLFEPSTIETPGFDPSDTVDFLDMVLSQDWDICADVQMGIQSRAHHSGVYSLQEQLPYKFNQWILKRLEG
ncbi:MAG: aromatic ring-hydroxylating dioxygenase subunit alpha [Chloroflexi bacterium]|nr:aromatic ring-hydroxylating dioxygenase subunit alpha [Chloroflexota bacterium]